MKRFPPLRNRGVTLVETVVSVGIMALIFSTMGYLVFAVGRNSLVVREQGLSQNQAGFASERIASTLRNARFLKGYSGDDTSTSVKRLVFEVPDPSEASGVREGVVAFVPATDVNSSNGTIKVFQDIDDYSPSTVATAKADWDYSNINDFKVNFHSNSWVTMSIAYTYRGFTLSTVDSNNDGKHDSLLAGNFTTDVIAKNHHPGESAHYANTTSTLMQL